MSHGFASHADFRAICHHAMSAGHKSRCHAELLHLVTYMRSVSFLAREETTFMRDIFLPKLPLTAETVNIWPPVLFYGAKGMNKSSPQRSVFARWGESVCRA